MKRKLFYLDNLFWPIDNKNICPQIIHLLYVKSTLSSYSTTKIHEKGFINRQDLDEKGLYVYF